MPAEHLDTDTVGSCLPLKPTTKQGQRGRNARSDDGTSKFVPMCECVYMCVWRLFVTHTHTHTHRHTRSVSVTKIVLCHTDAELDGDADLAGADISAAVIRDMWPRLFTIVPAADKGRGSKPSASRAHKRGGGVDMPRRTR